MFFKDAPLVYSDDFVTSIASPSQFSSRLVIDVKEERCWEECTVLFFSYSLFLLPPRIVVLHLPALSGSCASVAEIPLISIFFVRNWNHWALIPSPRAGPGLVTLDKHVCLCRMRSCEDGLCVAGRVPHFLGLSCSQLFFLSISYLNPHSAQEGKYYYELLMIYILSNSFVQ